MSGEKLIGLMASKDSADFKGNYHYVYGGAEIETHTNVLWVMTDDGLDEEELLIRFKGTKNIERVVNK